MAANRIASEQQSSQGWRWWLQLIQVRLRFIIIIGAVATLMSQWTWMRESFQHVVNRVSGSQHTHEVASGHEYFCPMDPGVLSAWPAICPICNMDLVPRKLTDGQVLPEGVIARMQFSPHRIQLAGLRTTTVKELSGSRRVEFDATVPPLSSVDLEAVIGIAVSKRDARAFREPHEVIVHFNDLNEDVKGIAVLVSADDPAPHRIRVTMSDELFVFPKTASTVKVKADLDPRLFLSDQETELLGAGPLLQVPASAIVDHGSQQIVFVQEMPGMFDEVPVVCGPRLGSSYPILQGLKAGQAVVSTGAFLVDAEARLNPALATGYFGADQPATSNTSVIAPVKTRKTASKEPLSEADLKLVEHQKICPVTELSLDSMGGPIPVMVGERKVFICCAGCEKSLLENPAKYLARIPPEPAASTEPGGGR